MAVGTSDRTPFKHDALHFHLQKVTSVLGGKFAKVPAKLPHVVIDFCAGHGDGSLIVGGRSSPEIIVPLQDKLAASVGRENVRSIFVEKNVRTAKKLRERLDAMKPQHPFEVLRMDAREFMYTPTCSRQAAFWHIDPNTIAGCPLNEGLLRCWTSGTIVLMTMGCNVGGVKRMPREERERWFEHPAKLCAVMASWHDSLLAVVCGDAHQWAYILTAPTKWAAETRKRLESLGRKHFESGLYAHLTHGVDVVSYRSDRVRWDEQLRDLFLTKKEKA